MLTTTTTKFINLIYNKIKGKRRNKNEVYF